MATIRACEARTPFSRLLERVERGEEILITRRGRPVACLMPATEMPEPEVAQATSRGRRERAKQAGVRPFDWDDWRADVDQGRR